MRRTLSIVGAGRVGESLAKRLRALGWRIGAVVTRSPKSARAAVRSIGSGSPYAIPAQIMFGGRALPRDLCDAILASDILLIATPDGPMPAVARILAHAGGRAWRGKIALHTSGATDSSVLAPLARQGAATGSIHPMQTFSGAGIPKLAGVTFTIEGHPRARRAALLLTRSLGGSPAFLAARDKPAYHTAAVLAAGSGFPLLEASTRLLVSLGFSRRRALETLLPLTRQALDNMERLGARAAWTGPLSRGDYVIITRHMRALRRYPREFQQAYAALARLAGRVLSRDPDASLKHIARALKGKPGSRR